MGRHWPATRPPSTIVYRGRPDSAGDVRRRQDTVGVGALDWIRTNDTRFRRAVLYPLSYEGLGGRLPAERPAHDQSGTRVAPLSCLLTSETCECHDI